MPRIDRFSASDVIDNGLLVSVQPNKQEVLDVKTRWRARNETAFYHIETAAITPDPLSAPYTMHQRVKTCSRTIPPTRAFTRGPTDRRER